MKNNFKKFYLIILILSFFLNFNKSFSNDVIIDAEKVDIKENGNLIYAAGSVNITDNLNITIKGKEAIYNKQTQVIEINNDVVFVDNVKNYKIKGDKIIFFRNTGIIEIKNNIILEDFLNNYEIFSNKIIYHQPKQSIKSFGDTKINYKNEFSIFTKDIEFQRDKKTFITKENTQVKDTFENTFDLSGFNFDLSRNLFKSRDIKLKDNEGNLLEIKNGYLDINSNELVGADFNFIFSKNILGNPENDPRLIGRYIITKKNQTTMKKSSFTTCKNKPGKCPAWSVSADEVTFIKEKKRIEYKNAWLKVYDKPIAYFPYFFHPDPTVKRQSGFLFPQFVSSNNLGFSTQIPYFHAIDEDKDITLSPRAYTNNNLFIQTEYRQAFKNSKIITDFSFNKKNETNSHFFSSLIGDFEDTFYEMKIETVSNKSYLKKYQIRSPLIKNYSTLNSSFLIENVSDESSFTSSINVIEDLSKNNSDKYEYIFPNYEYTKEIFLQNKLFDQLNYKSSGKYHKFNTNIDEANLINDLVFKSNDLYSGKNSISNLSILLRNLNTYGNLSSTYKDSKDYTILSSILYNFKYPLIKESQNNTNYLTPLISFRYSPNKGLNLKNETSLITYQNLFELDRFDNRTVENSGSMTLGLEYKKQNLSKEDRVKIGLAANFRNQEDKDLPISSSLGDKTSDIIGYSGVNITENLSFDYNFSIDEDLSGTNYTLASLNYISNKFQTSFEYLEKSKLIGDESHLTNITEFKINQFNSVGFETNRNIDKNLTDYYNLIYTYKNDCLEASIVYNKQFYNDESINSDKNIFFKFSFIPFGTVETTNINDK